MVTRLAGRIYRFGLFCFLVAGTLWSQPTSSPWSWSQADPDDLLSGLSGGTVVVGRVIEIEPAEGVRVYLPEFGFGSVQAVTIEVDQVLKGGSVRAGEKLHVLYPPHLSDVSGQGGQPPPGMTLDYVKDYFRSHGEFPAGISAGRDRFPDLKINEIRIFPVEAVDFGNSDGTMLWAHLKPFAAGRRFYRSTNSHLVGENRREIEVVARYFTIIEESDPDDRVISLVRYALELLRDTEQPLAVSLSAASALNSLHHDWKWGKTTQRLGNGQVLSAPAVRSAVEYLGDSEIDQIVEISLDRTRAVRLRSRLWMVLVSLRKGQWRPRKVDPKPFLERLVDPSEDSGLRRDLVWLLEELGGSNVREALQRILSAKPSSQEEEWLHARIRNSSLLK